MRANILNIGRNLASLGLRQVNTIVILIYQTHFCTIWDSCRLI